MLFAVFGLLYKCYTYYTETTIVSLIGASLSEPQLVRSVAGSINRVCINWPAVSLGHGVKFWRNMLDSSGTATHFEHRGLLTPYTLIPNQIYIGPFAYNKHCGCASETTIVSLIYLIFSSLCVRSFVRLLVRGI